MLSSSNSTTQTPLYFAVIIVIGIILLFVVLGVSIWLCFKYCYPDNGEKYEENQVEATEVDDRKKKHRKKRPYHRSYDMEITSSEEDSVAISRTRRSRLDDYLHR